MDGNWSYRNYIRWKKNYPKCSGKKQSPINIDTSNISECNGLCSLSVRYNPSSCNIQNMNITPIINYDTGSFIKFKGILYEMTKMTIHTPSMHSVNGNFYDMEVLLYHCLNRSSCSDSGGVIISILFKSTSDDSGRVNAFFNEFINEIPVEEQPLEQNVPVSADWNVETLFPRTKSFFYYEGSLPTPPCDENWTWIVFEETQNISSLTVNAFKLAFADNTRAIRSLNPEGTPLNLKRVVYYNSNVKFDDEDAYDTQKIDNEIQALQNKKTKILNNSGNIPAPSSDPVSVSPIIKTTSWYIKNKTYIRGLCISAALILIIICGIKFTKYLIRSGFIVKFMNAQIESKRAANNNRAMNEQTLAGNNGGNNGGGDGGDGGGNGGNGGNGGQSMMPPPPTQSE